MREVNATRRRRSGSLANDEQVCQPAGGLAADAFLPRTAVDQDAGSLGGAVAHATVVVLDAVRPHSTESPRLRSSPSNTRQERGPSGAASLRPSPLRQAAEQVG